MKAIIKLIITALGIFIFYQSYNILKNNPEAIQDAVIKHTSVSVSEILNNPNKYQKNITIKGRVGQTTNILGIRYYKLIDTYNNEAQLLIIPYKEIVPEEGNIIRLKGQIKQLIKAGDFECVIFKAIE